MGGGLRVLVAYGSQNVLLSGNPQMTYFYKAFKRYSHFSMESITVPLDGPNELSFDQPIQLRAKIPRQADLLSDMIFTFTIPDIYSKYITPNPPNGRICQSEFQWVRYLGAAIIQNASFSIGGQKIQEFDGAYLLSRALLDFDQDTFLKWKQLVGDVPDLVDITYRVSYCYFGFYKNESIKPSFYIWTKYSHSSFLLVYRISITSSSIDWTSISRV